MTFSNYLNQVLAADYSTLAIQIAIFGLAAGLAMLVVTVTSQRQTVRRRMRADTTQVSTQGRSDGTHARMVKRMLDGASSYFSTTDGKNARKLQAQLVQAGYFGAKAVAYYFLARAVGAGLGALTAAIVVPVFFPESEFTTMWTIIGMSGATGYLVPQFLLSRQRNNRADEYRNGFPDFLDLMVVCADAGLSLEAALERITRELAATYPAMSTNLSIASLEMRAGKPLGEALERLGQRLGLDEARAFAVLLQQSQELGSSLTEALRVYADDMRHQRMSRAEEKAYSLPAKLSVPLTVCIFPVVMVVALLPAVVQLMNADF